MAKTAKGTYFDPDELKDQIAKAMQAFRDFSREAETELDKALVVSALEVERDAKKFSPVDTGRLRSSITHRLGNNYAEVGTSVEYGIYQEFGSSKMRAQPFLTPAFEANKEKIKARLAAVVKKAADNAEH